MDTLSPTQLSASTHDLSRELVQKIEQGDLAEITLLYDGLYGWWDGGKSSSSVLQLQQSQLDYLLCKRLDQLHRH
jgi:hypothetical protein